MVADFDSGEPTLDEYLPGNGRWPTTSRVPPRCFVTCRDGRVVGFYALASAGGGARRHAGGAAQHARSGAVILLSRLAIDRKEQGQGLGAALLRDAIIRAVAAAEIIGVRALLVHALHEQARAFALRFRALADRPAAPAAVDQRRPRPARPAAEVIG